MTPPEKPHPWTIILSVTAILVSIVSFWQSCVSANVAKSIATPLVYSTEAKFTKGPTANEPFIVGAQVKNFGQIPARNIDTRFNVEFLPKGAKVAWTLNGQTSDASKEEILGSQDYTIFNYERRTPFTAQDIEDLKQGTRTLFYYGSAKYDSGNGDSTPMTWCWKYKPSVNDFWRCDPEDLSTHP